jgi:putative acetyltransferase
MKDVIEFADAESAADYQAARALITEYADRLGMDLSFQHFSDELDQLPRMYGSPGGCLILGRDRAASIVVACVGVRRISAETCEMKRLFVANSARGRGVGRRLALEAVRAATRLGYSRMLLDTLASMVAARRIYSSLGFKQIEPYYTNPVPGTHFMALQQHAELVPACRRSALGRRTMVHRSPSSAHQHSCSRWTLWRVVGQRHDRERGADPFAKSSIGGMGGDAPRLRDRRHDVARSGGWLVSATPGVVTTFAGIAGGYRLCGVSSDLSSWTAVGDFSAQFLKPSLVATGAGTLLGTWDTLNMIGAPIMLARRNAIVSCSGPALYDSITWVAPGSSNVHIFSATRYGPMAHGYHWVARVDP